MACHGSCDISYLFRFSRGWYGICPLFSTLDIIFRGHWICVGLLGYVFVPFLYGPTLKARRAIGRGELENDVNRQHIAEWLESCKQDHSLPTSTFDHITFPYKRCLLWLFQRLTRTYITTKSQSLENFLWTIAEIIFPYQLGYLLGVSLFFLGIINLSIDLSLTGFASTWGFGQLLPISMVILPFFSLTEVYARK